MEPAEKERVRMGRFTGPSCPEGCEVGGVVTKPGKVIKTLTVESRAWLAWKWGVKEYWVDSTGNGQCESFPNVQDPNCACKVSEM
jgi:hypothetical protein